VKRVHRPLLAAAVALTAAPAPGSPALDSPAAVADSVVAHARACHPARESERTEVTPLSSLETLQWTDGDRVLELLPPTVECGLGRQTYYVRVDRAGRTRVVPVAIDVRREVFAWVAKRELPKGAALAQDDLERKWVDATHLFDSPLTDAAGFAGRSPRRPLRAGEPLTEALLVPTPLVRRGERVKVIFARASFEITLDGVAREDGCAGQRIRIVNNGSGKTIVATVEGPGRVRL
jgi:flagella basal body P-ring formation protein FlgA